MSVIVGLLLAAFGGGLDASQALVMGLAKRWRWESIWLVWAVFGCLILPWASAFLLLRNPSPVEVFRGVSGESFAQVILFGAGWGVGAILFGLGIVRVGMGLGLGISVSLTAANGAIWPLIQSKSDMLLSPEAAIIYLAVGLLVLGIVLCSLAAYQRAEHKPLLARETSSFAAGVLCCIASGFASPMINLAFAEGIEINRVAQKLGASQLGAGMASVALIMTAGFVVNAIYCVYLLTRNRSWQDFAIPGMRSHWYYGVAMGVLQMAAFLIYSIAANRIDYSTNLGGAVLAWPVYTASVILVGNLEGLLRGEWKGSNRQTFVLLAGGLALLLAASSIVVALGSYLTTAI
jgi:L-rhamnose-H+ transport protein